MENMTAYEIVDYLVRHTEQITSHELLSVLIRREIAFAGDTKGKLHSMHEAYAVLKEEVEESQEELNSIIEVLTDMWETVRQDLTTYKQDFENECFRCFQFTKRAIMELVQVAAVSQRAGEMIRND